MLKPLVLAAALTLGSAALAAAAPIPPTSDLRLPTILLFK